MELNWEKEPLSCLSCLRSHQTRAPHWMRFIVGGVISVVTARDANGNIATWYTGTVVFGSSDSRAALPATYTFTAADKGVHTFAATLVTAGTQSITAEDTATGGLSGSEAGIAVNPAAASRFLITAPYGVTSGVAFSLTITVLDAYGNVVTGYSVPETPPPEPTCGAHG